MKICNHTAIGKPVDIPLEKLAAAKGMDEREKLAVASRHFETMFLKIILQETQKPVIKSSLIPNTTRDEIYRDLMVTTMAEAISKSQPLKIASLIQNQLSVKNFDLNK